MKIQIEQRETRSGGVRRGQDKVKVEDGRDTRKKRGEEGWLKRGKKKERNRRRFSVTACSLHQ